MLRRRISRNYMVAGGIRTGGCFSFWKRKQVQNEAFLDQLAKKGIIQLRHFIEYWNDGRSIAYMPFNGNMNDLGASFLYPTI